MLTIYNTLKREKDEFRPMESGKVSMYVCGPTVYDVPHIGHARSAYSFDVIRRYLEYAGFKVYFVRNVTDVDDKIIAKAVSELGEENIDPASSLLKDKAKEVAVKYLDFYHKQMDALGIEPPTVEPKATENIPQMIEFIEKLIEKDYAYTAGGDVYFSVEAFKDYGKLSNRDKDELLAGARVEPDDKKKSPLDFALWKEAKENEPSWQSPWGVGRPGWHIECSVMSTRLLGAQFDIHGGGLDLIFPRHENEIAQAEAATGKPFANCWIHNGLLTVGGEKMSKSLGNYITITDFLEKHTDPDLLKLAFLNSHYRSPMDYSDERMEEARRSKERIMIFFDKADRLKEEFPPGTSGEIDKTVAGLKGKFEKAMDDDFNTPLALSNIFEAVRLGNEYLADEDLNPDEKAYAVKTLKEYIASSAHVLGLALTVSSVDKEESQKINKLVGLREEARKNKDYAESDRLRDELMSMGIVVEDTPEGPVWRKS